MSDITIVIGDRAALLASIAAEVTRAETAETALSGTIAAEVTRAEGVEATKATVTALTAETTRAEGVEAGLNTGLTAANSAISAEVSRAESSETSLAGRATTLEATAVTLAGNISAETTRAEGVEATKASVTALTAEVTRAEGVEASLSSGVTANATAISTETTRAEGVEAAIRGGTLPTNLASLLAIVTAIGADPNYAANVATTISNLGAAVFGGTPDPTLNTLVKIGAALANNANFGSEVLTSISNLAGGELALALDSIHDLAAAIGGDPNYAANVATTITNLGAAIFGGTPDPSLNTIVKLAGALAGNANFGPEVLETLTNLATQISTETERAEGAEATINDAIAAALVAIAAKIGIGALAQTQGRPGDVRERYTSTLTGNASDASLLAIGSSANSPFGGVLRLVGAGVVATRERISLDPLETSRIRFAAARYQDPSDPSGATVRFGLQFLAGDKSALSQHVVEDMTLTVAGGRQAASLTLGAAAGTGIDLAWPAGATYVVPFVQAYDLDGQTDVQVLAWENVTDLLAIEQGSIEGVGVVAADLTAEIARAQEAETTNATDIANETTRAESAELVLAGKRGFSVGWLGNHPAPVRDIEIDQNGYGKVAREADGRTAYVAPNGTWSHEQAVTRGPSLGWFAGHLRAPIVAASLLLSGTALAAEDAIGAPISVLANGLWTDDPTLPRGPSLGWAAGHPSAPMTTAEINPAGKAVSSEDAAGIALAIMPNGLWSDDPLAPRGVSLGWLSPSDTVAASEIEITRKGSAVAAIGKVPLPNGLWTPDASQQRGPSAGFVGVDDDTAASTLDLTLCGTLIRAHGAGGQGYGLDLIATPNGPGRVEAPIDVPALVQAGPTLKIPSVRIKGPSGYLYTNATTVSSPAPAQVTVSGEAQTIRYNDTNLPASGALQIGLAYQFVTGNPAVRRTSDSAILVAGTDYSVDANRGIVMGLANVANFAATISYTGVKHRIDIVWADPVVGTVGIAIGTEVPRTASEYEPAVPAGMVPIFRVFRSINGAELEPVGLYRRAVRIDFAPQIEASIERNRRLAAPHRALIAKKAATASTFTLLGYGDSTTALFGPSGVSPSTVNGIVGGPRDRIGYYQSYDAATLALIPTSDLGDGLGNTAIQEGWWWHVVKALIARGSTVGYKNLAIAGTDSSATVGASGYWNQGYASQLAAARAANFDIAGYVPGQNDFTSYTPAQEYADLTAICSYLQNGGATLVILASPNRPDPNFRSYYTQWQRTCEVIERVADDLAIPFADTRRILDVNNTGAIGLSSYEQALANMQNHPPRKVQNGVGDLILELLS